MTITEELILGKEKTSPFPEKLSYLKSSTFTLSMQRLQIP